MGDPYFTSCDSCYFGNVPGSRDIDAYGMTGNGEFLCAACLVSELEFSRRHVPGGSRGSDRADYLRECRARIIIELANADKPASERERESENKE